MVGYPAGFAGGAIRAALECPRPLPQASALPRQANPKLLVCFHFTLPNNSSIFIT
uniref:Uncharacterized protein LOC104222920 n=1 Tax=Nicotiana sylvestris TaxID=4096 RepID=A0A1U7VXP8_NICSY|nr:PREDICTED: uncharacterized protein LOC104222920 [Nicotiana sylvestris]